MHQSGQNYLTTPTAIGIYKPADLRPIIQAYQGKDIPLEYARKEAEAKAKHVEEWKKKNPMSISGSSFASMFGISSAVRTHLILLRFMRFHTLQ